MQSRHELQALITGYRLSAALAVAADLGLSDELAAAGVYSEQDGLFSLTPLGDGLRSDVPGSVRPLAMTLTDPALWAAWGHVGHSIRTGENAFESLHGIDVWAHRQRQPEHNAIFNANMAALSARYADSIATAYDFSRLATVVDVGGGLGVLLDAVLTHHAHLTGTVFDQPHVVGRHAPSQQESVETRWRAESGSFFDAVPAADCLLLKWILHDWPDAQCTRILDACRAALNQDGVVLVVERIVGRPGHEVEVALTDLNMMVLPGGRERTEQEYAALFAAAGLRLRRVIHTDGPLSILEAVSGRS